MLDFLHEEQRAYPGAFSRYDMEVIYPYLVKMKKNDIYLEIGVMHGRSLAFARKFSEGKIYGIDQNNELEPEVRKMDINFIHASSNEAVKNWTLPIKVLFIDGDHSYQGVKDDFLNFSPFVKDDGVIFFHDCDETSPDVRRFIRGLKGWNKTICRKEMQDRPTSMARVER